MLVPIVLLAAGLEVSEPDDPIGGALEGLRGDLFDLSDARHLFPFLSFVAGGRWITAQGICSSVSQPTEGYAEAALTVGLDVLSLSRPIGLRVVLRGSKLLGVDFSHTADGGGTLLFLARF